MATYGSGIRTIETGTADQAMQRVREAGGNWGYLDPESVDAAIRAGGAKSEDALNALENLRINVITLQPGQTAYGNVTGTVPNLVFNLGIPRGRDGIGADEAAALVAEAKTARNASVAAQVAAEAAAQSASTAAVDAAAIAAPQAAQEAADSIRDNLAEDISTPGNPAYEALVDVAGTLSDPQTAGLIGDPDSQTRGALDALLGEADPGITATTVDGVVTLTWTGD